MLLVTLSGEIHIKGSWTRREFVRTVVRNLRRALDDAAPDARVAKVASTRLGVRGGDPEAAADAAIRTFGVQRVDTVRRLAVPSLGDLASSVAGITRPWVADRKFAVRVRRRGEHDWTSQDAERAIGTLLLDESAGVDLSHPEVEVRVEVSGGDAYLVEESRDGPGGLPLGSQERVLVLLSGGFDSAVAAWMLMRRGCPVDVLHFKLDCAQSDHALVVGHELWRRWGHDTGCGMHVIDFQPTKDALRSQVEPRLRQVVLKQLMVQAAGLVADRLALPALVTGESVGQVSSQTLVHLAAIDRATDVPMLRPLLGMTKQEIIDRSRSIGTYDLSARAREVCDLSEGRSVAVAAHEKELAAARASLSPWLIDEALDTWEFVEVQSWAPGLELERVGPAGPRGNVPSET